MFNQDRQDQNPHVRIARTTGRVGLAHAALNMWNRLEKVHANDTEGYQDCVQNLSRERYHSLEEIVSTYLCLPWPWPTRSTLVI